MGFSSLFLFHTKKQRIQSEQRNKCFINLCLVVFFVSLCETLANIKLSFIFTSITNYY